MLSLIFVPKHLGAVTPQIPIPLPSLTDLRSGPSLRPTVIPLRDTRTCRRPGESGVLRGLPCTPQRTGEHTPLGEPLGELPTYACARRNRLPLPDSGQRDIRATRMLAGHAPRGLPVTQQDQVSGMLGIIARCAEYSHTHHCNTSPGTTTARHRRCHRDTGGNARADHPWRRICPAAPSRAAYIKRRTTR